MPAAAAGLNGGLLVGADDVLACLQRYPSNTPWYRSSTRLALATNSGSRGKIQA
jgi:hypothetical protein